MSEVEALLREREGYVRMGKTGRVAQVDAELARFGVAVGDEAETVDEQPMRRGPGRPRKIRD